MLEELGLLFKKKKKVLIADEMGLPAQKQNANFFNGKVQDLHDQKLHKCHKVA
jgi:hypothetical protein